ANGRIEGFNNYLDRQRDNVNSVIFFWEGHRWRGVLDNPIVNGFEQFFNPVGNLLASAENIRIIGNEIGRIGEIGQGINAAANLNRQLVAAADANRMAEIQRLQALAANGQLNPAQAQDLANLQRIEALTPAERETMNMGVLETTIHNISSRPVAS